MSHPMPGAGLARSEPRPSQYLFPNNKLSFINKPLPTTASSNKYCVKCAISARKCCWVRSRESANGRAKNFPKQPYLSAIHLLLFAQSPGALPCFYFPFRARTPLPGERKIPGARRSCGQPFSVVTEGRIPATEGLFEIPVENFCSSL